MRRATPLIVLLLLVAPAAGEQVDYPDPGDQVPEVDLVDDAGTAIEFHVDVGQEMPEGGCLEGLGSESRAASALLVMQLQGGAAVLEIAVPRVVSYDAQNVEHVDFVGALPVDSMELVEGTWSLDLTVTDASGRTYECGDGRELEVTAVDDAASPSVSFPTATAGVIHLGPGQAIVPEVSDDTLGRVEYHVEGMPQFFLLKAPYIISSKSFFPGENELTLRATDRAGNAPTEAKVKVVVDGEAPELEVDLLNRTTFYAGIDNPVVVRVNDTSDYRVTVAFQGRNLVETGTGGEATNFTVGVPANRTGEELLRVRVVDAFGNTATFARTITVERLSTDARIVEVEQVDGPVIVGENVTVRVVMEQPRGVANVTFALLVDGAERGAMEVPSRDENETTLSLALPPGRHTLTVQAVQPEGVLANGTRLTARVPVEVYLARVTVDDDDYHVRATAQGLPAGVVAPNGTTLATELVEQGGSSVYAFEAGGERYYWDPEGPVEQEFTEAEPPGDGGNESPGAAPALLVLALLALAVALRRR